jgi:hypothetical protein
MRAEQFLADDRAREIRSVCMVVAHTVEKMFQEERTEAHFQQLLQCRVRLDELGIKPMMQCGLPEQAYEEDPILMAEYVAGEWMDALSVHTQLIYDFSTMRSYVNLTYCFLDIHDEEVS